MLRRILAYLGSSGNLFLNIKNAVFNGEQKKKESIICVGMWWENSSLAITICHHLASLVMSKGDTWDAFFYPTLTLMIDSYSYKCSIKYRKCCI